MIIHTSHSSALSNLAPIFLLLENQELPLALSSFVVCEHDQLFIDFASVCSPVRGLFFPSAVKTLCAAGCEAQIFRG